MIAAMKAGATAEGTATPTHQGTGWIARDVKNILNLDASWEVGWSGRSS